MASPTVETTATTTTDTVTSHAITMPSGITAGDLLVVAFACDGSPDITWPGDWTKLGTDITSSSDGKLSIGYKEAAGSDSLSITTSASEKAATLAWRISGAEDPDTQAPERSTGAEDTGTNPDPDSVTPTGGSKDYLFLAVAGDGTSDPSDDDPPTNYSNLIHARQGGGLASSHASIEGAERQLTASSEDPGTFNAGGAITWTACTIAVHPGGGVTLQQLYPDADIVGGGWDTQPTTGQDLFAQVDETTPSDTDYIEQV